jgi:hypothetical protein
MTPIATPAGSRWSDSSRATFWLAAALAVTPYLQTLEWDFEHSGVLALLPAALWSGRRLLTSAGTRLAHASPLARIGGAVAVLVVLVSLAESAQPAASLVECARWLGLLLAALLAGQVVAEKPVRAAWLLGALATGGAAAAAWHWLRWKSGAAPEAAFYSHHRLMGLHLMGAALAATALAVTASTPAGRRLGLAAGLLCWGGLLWSGGRAPLLGLGGGLLAWFWFGPATQRKALVLVSALHLAGGLALSAALPANRPWLGWTRIWQRTVAPAPEVGVTSQRTSFWQDAAHRVGDAPWFGHGPDSYRYLDSSRISKAPSRTTRCCRSRSIWGCSAPPRSFC